MTLSRYDVLRACVWEYDERTLIRRAGGSYAVLPDGVNLSPYLDRLYFNIRRNLLAMLPESALNGEKGAVVVIVQIEKDGSLPEGAVRIVSSCGKEDVDAAAKSAIRTAAPFGRFPEAYVGAKLDLLFTFGFAPQEPAQKPKVVPVDTGVNHIRQI